MLIEKGENHNYAARNNIRKWKGIPRMRGKSAKKLCFFETSENFAKFSTGLVSLRLRKGVSLPVNVVVVIVMAALVLAIIVMFFGSYSGQSTKSMSHAAAWSQGCMNAKAQGCKEAAFDYAVVTPAEPIFVSGYDPGGNDPAGGCKVDGTGVSLDNCGDNLLVSACKNFFGLSAGQSSLKTTCRDKCCG